MHTIASSTLAGNCTHGEMRLVDVFDDSDAMTRRGKVEVCVNNAWGAVCRGSFSSPEADVVCKQQSGFTTNIGAYTKLRTIGCVYLYFCTFPLNIQIQLYLEEIPVDLYFLII